MTYAWKVLDGTAAYHGGNGEWHRPHGARPGRWMPHITNPRMCKRGYHVLDSALQLLEWLGPDIWIVEWRGASTAEDNKRAVEQARLIRHVDAWNDRTSRLFAADCAEDVLHIFEAECPRDNRPRAAIEAARAYAAGDIDKGSLDDAWAAASDAASAAVSDDAWAAAWAAARAAAWAAASDDAWNAAWADAWAAASAAASAAVSDDAWDVAWAAVRQHQAERLAAIIGELPAEGTS